MRILAGRAASKERLVALRDPSIQRTLRRGDCGALPDRGSLAGSLEIRMESLETKIPPPILTAAVALAMWGVSRYTPLFEISSFLRGVISAVALLTGIGFSAAGLLEFRRAQTTVNPLRPEQASSLVDSGVYRMTRNPMYVGLCFVLVAWAVFLSSGWALLGPLVFMLYIGRFQIAPEERALTARFGDAYADYQSRVRRWL